MSLLVLTGPPGAGKSTVAEILASDESPSVLVTGDRFFEFLARGRIAPWLPESEEQNVAVTEGAAAFTGRVARDRWTVYDGVVGPWFLERFLAATGLPELDYAVLLPDEATCLHRVATRTGHGFGDPDATRHMHREFAGAPVDPRHVLTDPPGTPADTAALVRHRLADGVLTVTA